MNKYYKLLFSVVGLFLAFITINKVAFRDFAFNSKNRNVINANELDNEKYKTSLPTSSKLKISSNLENKIYESINYLDSNFFLKGRDNNKMENPKMINQVINEAKLSGGDASGNTSFKNLIINDLVAFSIATETNPKMLKLIDRYGIYNQKFNRNEVWYKYTGKIKIVYHIKVGKKEKTAYYYENTEICSPIKLI